MSYDFSGRRCLVTGAGKGIGRGVALTLVKSGGHVFALTRTQNDLDSLLAECEVEGKKDMLTPICVDLSDWEASRSVVERCLPIDLLVNNVGAGSNQPFIEVSESQIDLMMNVNFKSMVSVTQVVARRMITDSIRGSIVNVSSQASLAGLQDHTVYSATKGAMDAASRVMAVELGPHGIRVNTVHPTVVMTPMGREFWTSDAEKSETMLKKIPLRKFAEIEDVVAPIVFLLSDGARMIHGAAIPVDGGFLAA